jgi:Arc/MetJ family transcription regulator
MPVPQFRQQDSILWHNGSMKTTIDIPEKELADAMRFTKARTKREAVVTALHDFNRRRRMGALLRHSGTCNALVTVEELRQQRRKD